MTALESVTGFHVPRETECKLLRFKELLLEEAQRQNLIARATIPNLDARHILDAAQLLRFARGQGPWLDIGSGGGLPGIVLSILSGEPTTLVEPRRLRAEFLMRVVDDLSLGKVTVERRRVEQVVGTYGTITARAVAALPRLFQMAEHLSSPETIWILPKGRSGAKELAEAERTWQGRFRLEPSMTEEGAVIVVGTNVTRRKGRG